MSPDDLAAGRAEAAAIARGLARRLERERAAGLGDLAARGARGGTAAPAPRGTNGAPAAVVAALAPARPAAGEAETDLFGRPVARVAPSAPADAIEPGPAGPAPEAPLNPAGWEARAALAAAAEPVLEQIAAEVRVCQKCGLWEGRNQAVPGVGSARSGLVFIGEAPGADEDRLGEPFVGRAGQLLDKIIQAMDDARLIPGVPLSRATVFIGNIIHCRPPENRVPLPFEIEQSSPYLRRQLEALKPRVICCLGKTAGEFLLGSKGSLASMRGRDVPSRGLLEEPRIQAPGVGGHAVPGARVPLGLGLRFESGGRGIPFRGVEHPRKDIV